MIRTRRPDLVGWTHIASPQGRRRHRVDAAGGRVRPGGRSLCRGSRRPGRRVLASRGTDHGRPCRQARERRRIRAAPRPTGGAGAAPLRATPVRRHRHGDLRGISDHRRPAGPPPVRIADALDGGSRRRRSSCGQPSPATSPRWRLVPERRPGQARSTTRCRRGCTPASAAATSATLSAPERPDEDRGARCVRHGRIGAGPGARPRAPGGGGLAAAAPRRGRQRHVDGGQTSRTRRASTERWPVWMWSATSSTRWVRTTSPPVTVAAHPSSPARRHHGGWLRSCTWAGWATIRRPLRAPREPPGDGALPGRGQRAADDHPRGHGGGAGKRGVRHDPGAGRPAAGDGVSPLGVHADAADRRR